ncbi:hypothetical protein [Janthinobacterium sp. LB3P112]
MGRILSKVFEAPSLLTQAAASCGRFACGAPRAGSVHSLRARKPVAQKKD